MHSKLRYCLLWLCLLPMAMQAQDIEPYNYSEVWHTEWVLKLNLAPLVTVSPNLTVANAVGNRKSWEFAAGYNNWIYGEDARIKHMLLRSGLRYWPTEVFDACFMGEWMLSEDSLIWGGLLQNMGGRHYVGPDRIGISLICLLK